MTHLSASPDKTQNIPRKHIPPKNTKRKLNNAQRSPKPTDILKLPRGMLRELVLSEPDQIDVHEFVVKANVWNVLSL